MQFVKYAIILSKKLIKDSLNVFLCYYLGVLRENSF